MHSNFFSQICQGNNQDDRVNDTHHFLFADVFKRGHDTLFGGVGVGGRGVGLLFGGF